MIRHVEYPTQVVISYENLENDHKDKIVNIMTLLNWIYLNQKIISTKQKLNFYHGIKVF